MALPSRALAALTAAALALTAVATPAYAGASAANGSSSACPLAPTSPTTLPALSDAKLSAAIANLPDGEISGALVQIRGSAGCWQGTSGIGNARTGQPAPQNGRFRIGSMTKTFTAVVALQLVAEHRLDLDRSVQHYLPGFLPDDYPTITVRRVLTYTSGINGTSVPFKQPDWFFAHRFDHWAPGSQLDLTKPLAFPPGTAQRYANADFWLAGLLIERVTGHRWSAEVTNRIIRPLHLTGTTAPDDYPRINGPHAHGYEIVDGTWVDVTTTNPSLQWSAAAVISTAADLDRFLVAVFTGRLLPQPQLDLMFTVPDVPTYGSGEPAAYTMGLSRIQFGNLTLWGKSGDRPGYNNGMGATRDLSRRLVYSVNTLHMGGDQPPSAQSRIIMAAFT
jgi:D-alanyl-D-alanine carboxypeptidase